MKNRNNVWILCLQIFCGALVHFLTVRSKSTRRIEFGFMSKIFSVFTEHEVSVDCVTTSEIAVAISVDKEILGNQKFLEELDSENTDMAKMMAKLNLDIQKQNESLNLEIKDNNTSSII